MTSAPDLTPWADRIDDLAPTVLLLGGLFTSPPLYRPLRRRLLEHGADEVVLGRVWTPDWLLAGVRGLGPVVTRCGRGLLAACAHAAVSDGCRGAPILVIGHSAGGMVSRLLTSPEPFERRRLGAAGLIGAIVTLGTPHNVSDTRQIGQRVGIAAATFANRVVPGATFAPTVGYVSVASRHVVGRRNAIGRARVAHRLYADLLGDDGDPLRGIEGDGLVPVRAALLAGSRQVVLDDVVHGPLSGDRWYGSEGAVDRWWPVAVEAWRDALRARATHALARVS